MKKQLSTYDTNTFEYRGNRECQYNPDGTSILQAIGATPTLRGPLKDGYAQVFRQKRWWDDWRYAHLPLELAAAGEDGTWFYIEDHRQMMDEQGRMTEDTGTPYWLSAEGDNYHSESRYAKELGPLPVGHRLTRPVKPLATAQAEKRGEIQRGYDAALTASITMPEANPTPELLAVETSALLAVDPDGLDSIRDALGQRRVELLVAVDGVMVPPMGAMTDPNDTEAIQRAEDAAISAAVAFVEAIKVSYPV